MKNQRINERLTGQNSITKRLIINILGAVFLMNMILLGLIVYETADKGSSFADEIAVHRSESVAMDVKGYIDQSIETTATLASTLNTLRKSGNVSREDISLILKDVLGSNSEYLALWTIWEENAFDGRDNDYMNHPQFTETAGRMNLSFYKDGNTILQEVAEIEDYDEDYYVIPKQRRRRTVTPPYFYSFTDNPADEIYMTSVVVPIMERNTFLGVIGLDISLERLSSMVNELELYQSGRASVISNDLQIAAHQDYSLRGQQVNNFLKVDREQSVDAILNGSSHILRDKKEENLLRTFTPLVFNQIDEPWSIMVEVPLREVNRALVILLVFMGIMGVVSLIVIALVVWTISRKITRPIISTISSVEQVAEGNLDAEINYTERKDEIGQLASALQTLVEKLKEILGGVKEGSDNVAAASQQVSSTAQQISEGGTEQASSVEEVSSSMEQMVANISQNTDNARETEKIARKVSSGIQNVSEASQESLQSVKTIAQKISVISEISRQTNILALNAAVEAARAGEHGRGFAVVAAEVRKLAETSKAAADEINALAVKSVDVTEKAGQMMGSLMPELNKTTQLISEVTAASIEQNSGAEQVNSAIVQLNQITQQNAASSEEMAASSEQLAKQAEYLMEMVSYFRIESQKKKEKQTSRPSNGHHSQKSNGWHSGENQAPLKKIAQNGFSLQMDNSTDSQYEKF